MHSALKKDGRALYEYARAGEHVAREPRHIVIHELSLQLEAPNIIRMRAKVSKGTYIRTLGEDIGEALGCGGHLTSLRRVATGQFQISQCVTLEALERMDEGARVASLLPVASLLAGHTSVTLDSDNAGRFLSGLRRRGDWRDDELVAVYAERPPALLGTAHVKAGELIPGRLLSPPEVEQILESNS